MRIVWLAHLWLALPGAGHAMAADLTVTVAGVRGAAGTVRMCVFSTPRGFPDCTADPSIQRRGVAAVPGVVRTVFTGLAPGSYAVTVFHDEKNTGKLDTNLLGMPRSGVGASNDPVTRFGPPRFSDAAFTLTDKPASVTITLRYP